MLEADIRLLSPTKLASLAKYYGLRQQGKRGTWVIRKSVTDPKTHKEHTFKRSTKTADLRLAVHRAAAWVDEFAGSVHGSRLPTLSETARFASLEQIGEHYRRAATCADISRRKNLANLRALVEAMHPDHDYTKLSAEVLDGRLVRQWQLRRKEQAETLLPNREACEQAKRGANAVYRQARSVFSAAMLRAYEDAGLRLPPVTREFAQQGFLAASRPPPSEQIPPDIIIAIVKALPALREKNPGAWACVVLMFCGGLRNSEAEMSLWPWLLPSVDGNFQLQLHTQGEYKPKTDGGSVSLSAEVVELLRTVKREGDDHLVPAGTPHERTEACNREVNAFLKSCGVVPVKGKIAYRMRGHAITEIMLRNGMDAAKEFARHTSMKTTEIYKGAQVPYRPLGMLS